MSKLTIMAVALLGAVFLAIWERKKRIGSTPGRPIFTDEELYNLYFRKNGFNKNDVLSLLNEIAHTLGVQVGVLRPGDRFGKDVGGGFVTTPDLDTLSELASEKAATSGTNVNIENIDTVFDYISAFARKDQQAEDTEPTSPDP